MKVREKTFLRGVWNQFYSIPPAFFEHFGGYLASIGRIVTKIQAIKIFFAGFETSYTVFADLFWALWWLFCVNQTYRWCSTGKNDFFLFLKQVLWHLLYFLSTLVAILCCSDPLLPRYGRNIFFACVEIGFTTFAVFSLALCGYFALIGRTIAKIQVEMFVWVFWKQFHSIHLSIMSTLVVILCQSDILFLRYRRKLFLRALKPILRHSPQFFEHFGSYFASIGSTIAKMQR